MPLETTTKQKRHPHRFCWCMWRSESGRTSIGLDWPQESLRRQSWALFGFGAVAVCCSQQQLGEFRGWRFWTVLWTMVWKVLLCLCTVAQRAQSCPCRGCFSPALLPEPFSHSEGYWSCPGEEQADGRDQVVSVLLPQEKNCPVASLPSRKGTSDLFQLNRTGTEIFIVGDLCICLFKDWHDSFHMFCFICTIKQLLKGCQDSSEKNCNHKCIGKCV